MPITLWWVELKKPVYLDQKCKLRLRQKLLWYLKFVMMFL